MWALIMTTLVVSLEGSSTNTAVLGGFSSGTACVEAANKWLSTNRTNALNLERENKISFTATCVHK